MNHQGAKDFSGEIYSNGHATKLEGPEEKWRDLSSNRKYNNDYEMMMWNSLPASNMRTNAAMHAVLESELEEDAESGKRICLRHVGWTGSRGRNATFVYSNFK